MGTTNDHDDEVQVVKVAHKKKSDDEVQVVKVVHKKKSDIRSYFLNTSTGTLLPTTAGGTIRQPPKYRPKYRPEPQKKTTAKKKKKKEKKMLDIDEITKLCPLEWDGHESWTGRSSSANINATVAIHWGWGEDPGNEARMKKALEYLDSYRENFDHKAAEKALREKGDIDDLYEFVAKKDGKENHWDGGYWRVSCHDKSEIHKSRVGCALEYLCEGGLCEYPEGYNSDCVDDDNPFAEGGRKMKKVKEAAEAILEKASYVASCFWSGLDQDEENNCTIKREDYYFFKLEDGQKFLLLSQWSYVCG